MWCWHKWHRIDVASGEFRVCEKCKKVQGYDLVQAFRGWYTIKDKNVRPSILQAFEIHMQNESKFMPFFERDYLDKINDLKNTVKKGGE